jgi:micrococcal nuclease
MRPAILLFILLLFLTGSGQAAALRGQVSWIDDGDSLQVEGIGKVRLLGIDTPEYRASSRDRFYQKRFAIPPDRLRLIAAKAKEFNLRRVKNHTVRLEPGRVPQDKHGRLLAYVYLPDGTMLNRLLLQKGLASVFRRYNFRYKADFLATEQKARDNHLGLWK